MRLPAFLISCMWGVSAHAGDLQLTLPPVVYAVPEATISIYHDNIVLTQKPEDCRFEFTCDVGQSEPKRWTVTPAAKDVGDHSIEVVIKDSKGAVLERGKTTLHVSPRDAGEGKTLRLLVIGDSLTHGSVYPNEIYRWMSLPGNPKLAMLGTHKPPGVKSGVAHEGYGGWKWSDFLTKFNPKPATDTAGPLARKTTSPFVFPSADGKTGVFDLNRYFREHCEGRPPEIITFLLGINDCFAAKADDPEPKITEVLANAEKLLAEFRKAAPQARLAVGITTAPNSRQEAFTANYQDRYSRWNWKRIQHRLVQRMLAQLGGREKENIYLVPTELNLDPVDGYPVNNAVHPNPVGYAQIGTSFYCWMKAQY